MFVTRFAPSPTGLLHLGHAYAAITAYESGDDFLLRIEDIDKGRSRDKFIQAIFYDLKWLGLSWDEPSLRQSTRMGAYAESLVKLKAQGLVYPCFCTRAEIAAEIARIGEAQHGPEGVIYPGTCKALPLADGQKRIAAGEAYALRLDTAKAAALTGPLTYTERGLRHAVDPFRFGDVVIARKDMPTSYHLAVVVDDAHQQVSLVTRGEDLRSATHIQRLLQALLKLPEPCYAHHALVLDESGRKFSKRDGALSLESMRHLAGGREPACEVRTASPKPSGLERCSTSFPMSWRSPITNDDDALHCSVWPESRLAVTPTAIEWSQKSSRVYGAPANEPLNARITDTPISRLRTLEKPSRTMAVCRSETSWPRWKWTELATRRTFAASGGSDMITRRRSLAVEDGSSATARAPASRGPSWTAPAPSG